MDVTGSRHSDGSRFSYHDVETIWDLTQFPVRNPAQYFSHRKRCRCTGHESEKGHVLRRVYERYPDGLQDSVQQDCLQRYVV